MHLKYDKYMKVYVFFFHILFLTQNFKIKTKIGKILRPKLYK